MEIWQIFVALTVLALLAAALKGKARARRTYAYKAAELLTKGERAFADALDQCIPPGARLLAKVRMADLINTAPARDRGGFSKISQKHMDFVVTTRDWTVLAAIELNDKSHDARDRRERDDFVQKACEGAGIRLHFVRAAARYDLEALRALFQEARQPAQGQPAPPARATAVERSAATGNAGPKTS